MKRFENSSSYSSPWDFSQTTLGEEHEHLPIHPPNFQTQLSNTVMGNPGGLASDVHNVGEHPDQIHLFNNRFGDPNLVNAVDAGNAGEPSMDRRPMPRGRPRGSKNRPIEENDSAMKCTFLEVPPAVEIITWLVDYANAKKVSIVVLGGSGPISHVTLSHMGSQLPPKIYGENLGLVSFTGSYTFSRSTHGAPPPNFFNVSLLRMDGKVVGGTTERMISMGIVVLTVAIYNNPEILEVSMQTPA